MSTTTGDSLSVLAEFAVTCKLSRLCLSFLDRYPERLSFAGSSNDSMNFKPQPLLINLLRAYRKRTAFSQDEIAFLLGAKSGSKASRHEQMDRLPELQTALGYEAIFNCPVSQLFPELYKQIETAVRKRAKTLAKRALIANSTALMARKRQSVENIINNKKNNGDKK